MHCSDLTSDNLMMSKKIIPKQFFDGVLTVVLLGLQLHVASGQAGAQNGAYRTPTVTIEPIAVDSVIVKEFGDVILKCTADGHPKPSIRWSIGGELSRRNLDTSNQRLVIKNISRAEEGRVVCRAENGVGHPSSVSKAIRVYYLDKPSLTVHWASKPSTPNSSIWRERTVYMPCEVKSNPPALFIWLRQGVRINPTKQNGLSKQKISSYRRGVTSVVFTINDATEGDFGDYTCLVSLPRRQRIAYKRANFTLSALLAPPQIQLLSKSTLIASPGDRVLMSCRATAGYPTPTIRWVRNDGMLTSRATVRNGGNTLRISNVQVDDSGTYSCIGSNNVDLPKSKEIQVMVRYLSPMVYWITPDALQDDRKLALGTEIRLTCYTEASPYFELQYSWFKLNAMNDRVRIVNVDNMSIMPLQEDEVRKGVTFPAQSSRLVIRDLVSDDYGIYECAATLSGDGSVAEVSAKIAISPDSAPARISAARDVVIVREGEKAVLECQTHGVPKPLVLWQKDGNQTMPSGNIEEVVENGRLVIANTSREDAGFYTCSPARYNGFSKLSKIDYEAEVELQVKFAPVVDQPYKEVRKRFGDQVPLYCNVADAFPTDSLTYVWHKAGSKDLLPPVRGYQPLMLSNLSALDFGRYTCEVQNEVGFGRCVVNVTGQAYSPEFLYERRGVINFAQPGPTSDTFNYNLSWTQKAPDTVEQVTEYRVRWRRVGRAVKQKDNFDVSSWSTRTRTISGPITSGQVISCQLDQLASGRYEVEVTPKSSLGYGETGRRIIEVRSRRSVDGVEPTLHPSGKNDSRSGAREVFPHHQDVLCNVDILLTLRRIPFYCSFDQSRLCKFTQDNEDDFDWILNSADNQRRRTPGTGPLVDRTNYEKTGAYMYIESSGVKQGSRARLISPMFVPQPSSRWNCLRFYYHMRGRDMGTLRVLQLPLRSTVETELWSKSGEQGDDWMNTWISIPANDAYQIVFESIITKSNAYRSDMAIDEIAFDYADCPTIATPQLFVATTSGASSHVISQSLIRVAWWPVKVGQGIQRLRFGALVWSAVLCTLARLTSP